MLLSRASARSVLGNISAIDEAVLDFSDIRSVGPAFADEIFRVIANDNPKLALISINANEQVTAMIRRALAAKERPTFSG